MFLSYALNIEVLGIKKDIQLELTFLQWFMRILKILFTMKRTYLSLATMETVNPCVWFKT